MRLGAVALAVLVLAGCGDENRTATTQAAAVTVAQPAPVTPQQAERASRIAFADPRVRKLGEQMDVRTVGAWTVGARKLGAIVEIKPHGTLSGEFEWPVAEIGNETNDPPYEEEIRICSVDEATSLRGFVDLRRGKLVQLEPGPGSSVECQEDAH